MQIRKNSFLLIISLLTFALLLCSGCNKLDAKVSWQNELYVPTYIDKIDNTYFIVDCWHHRVIYNDTLTHPLNNWHTLTDEDYVGGHTIASDGDIYVLENTDRDQVLCYEQLPTGEFSKVNTIGNITGRPHYTLYDEANKLFYTISSKDARIYVFNNINHALNLVSVEYLPELQNGYTRSISIIDNQLYTSASNGYINVYNIINGKFELATRYPISEIYYGMNQIYKINDYFYVTINTDNHGDVTKSDLLKVKNLDELCSPTCSSLKQEMDFIGQPYFISFFDDTFYITQISETHGNGIKKFTVDSHNNIISCSNVFYYESPSPLSVSRYKSKYAIEPNSNQLVDMFIFSGQSNMSGKSNQPALAPLVSQGYEYRAISDPYNLYNIHEPFGINENSSNGINDVIDDTQILKKKGGLVSSFAATYFSYTNIPIVAVSASQGATPIEDFLPGKALFKDLLARTNSCINFINTSDYLSLRHKYLVWCQGESNGDRNTSYEDYYNSLTQLYDSLIINGPLEAMFIIQTGNNVSSPTLYKDIQQAQSNFCATHDNCELVSTLAKSFIDKGFMIDDYHYSQIGYNILGEDAAKNASLFTSKLEDIHDK